MRIDKAQAYEWTLAGCILLALFALTNPFGLWMPGALELTIAMILAVFVIGFSVFFWRERPRDEREAQYGSKAGRISYLAGGLVLLLAIVLQSFMHHLDPWLPAALGTMVLTKLVTSAWLRQK